MQSERNDEAVSQGVKTLEWDTEFFGFPTGSVDVAGSSGCAERIVREARSHRLRVCYLFASGIEAERCAAGTGAYRVDSRATLVLDLDEGSTAVHGPFELGTARDRPTLHSLAWQSAEQSRFRTDPHMPQGKWRELYRIWIDNSLSGEIADAVLVERSACGEVVGMITLKVRGDVGSIGLFAVNGSARGLGVGTRLLAEAERFCRRESCRRISVATQGGNAAAIRAYEKAGYRIESDVAVYHLWLE